MRGVRNGEREKGEHKMLKKKRSGREGKVRERKGKK